MTTPLVPDCTTFTRMFLGTVDVAAERAGAFGVTRSVGVVEIPGGTFAPGDCNTIRQPGGKDGSFRLETWVGDNQVLFDQPGTSVGFIAVSSVGPVWLLDVPTASIEQDIAVNEFRRYVIANSGTNGLPAIGPDSMHDSIGSAISAPENGAEKLFGIANAGQQLLMRVVVQAFTGTEVTFQIEHDTTGFAGPTDAFPAPLTLTPTIVDQGGLRAIVDVDITDTFWRVVIGGTFSNLEALVAFGIT